MELNEARINWMTGATECNTRHLINAAMEISTNLRRSPCKPLPTGPNVDTKCKLGLMLTHTGPNVDTLRIDCFSGAS